MTDTCNHTTDSGKSCGNPAGDDGYCYLDGHGPGDEPEAPDDLESWTIGEICRLIEDTRNESLMMRGYEALLRHERESDG